MDIDARGSLETGYWRRRTFPPRHRRDDNEHTVKKGLPTVLAGALWPRYIGAARLEESTTLAAETSSFEVSRKEVDIAASRRSIVPDNRGFGSRRQVYGAIVRTAALTRAFAVFLAAIATTATVVGVHDAATAGTRLGVTAVSIALVAIGVVSALAAWELIQASRPGAPNLDARPHRKDRVLVALLLVILLGVYVFFSAIGSASSQRPIVILAALALMAVPLLGLRFFHRDGWLVFPRVQTSIALGLIGTAIGGAEFFYQNQYIPSNLPFAVSLNAEMQLVDAQKSFDVIRVTTDYQNIGGSAVTVIGSTYTLTGSRLFRCIRPATLRTVEPLFDSQLVDPQATRFMAEVWEEHPVTVLAAGKLAGDGKRLDPNVPASRTFDLFVPRGRFQLLRFRAQLFAIPASVMLAAPSSSPSSPMPAYGNLPRDNDLYGFWRVRDKSWLDALIDGRGHWVVIRYELVGSPHAQAIQPTLRVTARFPAPTWSEARPSPAVVEKLFVEPEPSDTSEPFTDIEMALAPIAAPSAADLRRGPMNKNGTSSCQS